MVAHPLKTNLPEILSFHKYKKKEEKMKKILMFLMITVLVFSIGLFGIGCKEEALTVDEDQVVEADDTDITEEDEVQVEDAKDAAEGPEDNLVQVDGMLWGVEPLPEKTKLVMAFIGSTSPPLTNYIAMQKGWLEALNLEIEPLLFPNGPAQMEASSSWDLGSTGIGGVITGIIGHDLKIIGTAARDEGGHQAFFARPDSPIVQAGTGHTDVPELYGTAEAWKEAEILTSVGTTNHYVLYRTIKAFGLTMDEMNVVNMDIATANTAFMVGQGDVLGVWGPLLYADDKKDLIMVSNDAWVKTGIVTNYMASSEGWKNKQNAIEKWLEITIMGGEWAMANMEEAAEFMVEMNEIDGYPTTVEDNFKIIEDNPFATLEENYNYFTQMTDEGDMLIAESQTYMPMSIFVEMGNFTGEQLGELLSGNNFLSDPIASIYNNVMSD